MLGATRQPPIFWGLLLHHCAAIPSLGPCALGTHGLAPCVRVAQGCSATQPCAIKIQKHMAHTAPSANRPTSPTSPTSQTFFAHSIGSAQCALPANRPRSHVFLYFHSAWLTESQSPTPYSSVPVRTSPFYTAHTLCIAPCAPPASGNVLCTW